MPFVSLDIEGEETVTMSLNVPCSNPDHYPSPMISTSKPVKWQCATCGQEVILLPLNSDWEPARMVCISICAECGGSGYAVHPENGIVKGRRCSKGCRVDCSICNDPNCDNPGGQH